MKINKSDSEVASVPVRLYFYNGLRWINIVVKAGPISTKKILNIISYSFLSTIILDLFSPKQSLTLVVGIIYNTETWKVRTYIIYYRSTFTKFLVDWLGRKLSLYFSGAKRIEDYEKESNIYRQFSITSKLKTLKMFPLTLN